MILLFHRYCIISGVNKDSFPTTEIRRGEIWGKVCCTDNAHYWKNQVTCITFFSTIHWFSTQRTGSGLSSTHILACSHHIMYIQIVWTPVQCQRRLDSFLCAENEVKLADKDTMGWVATMSQMIYLPRLLKQGVFQNPDLEVERSINLSFPRLDLKV